MTQQIIATLFLFAATTLSVQLIVRIFTNCDIPRYFTLIAGISWAGFVATMWIF